MLNFFCKHHLPIAFLLLMVFPLKAKSPSETPYTFTNALGQTVECFWGTLEVPENRTKPNSRTLTLAYVRFPALTPAPGPPIVYLAGGPGGSGIDTAKGRRFPLFMELRQVSDVIAFDQRGTGASNQIPPCSQPESFDRNSAITLENMLPGLRKNAAHCSQFWADQGVDLSGYNTRESAADLEALRVALGAKKLNLWGISYGTHLALASMKDHSKTIHRAVLASSEGLDHTLKLPGWSDAFFHRVQQVIRADPKARGAYPDLLGSMRKVFQRLEKEPVSVPIKTGKGDETYTLSFDKSALQLIVSWMFIKNPSNISNLPAAFKAMEGGDFSYPAQVLSYIVFQSPNVSSGMGEAMDAASGISSQRWDQFQFEAKTALIGNMLNFPMPFLADAYGNLDLGDTFREPLETDIPTLFLNGTLDGRTFPEETWAIMRGFSRGLQIIVENAGHDLFMASPEVSEAIARFFKDGSIQKTLIHIPPPQFK